MSAAPAERNQVRTRCQRMTAPGPTRRKKSTKSAPRGSLSLDNGGPHKCSARPCREAPKRRVLPDTGAPLAPGDGHASRRNVEGALGGVVQVGPVASIRHVRLACQPDVELAAAEPRLEVGHVKAD